MFDKFRLSGADVEKEALTMIQRIYPEVEMSGCASIPIPLVSYWLGGNIILGRLKRQKRFMALADADSGDFLFSRFFVVKELPKVQPKRGAETYTKKPEVRLSAEAVRERARQMIERDYPEARIDLDETSLIPDTVYMLNCHVRLGMLGRWRECKVLMNGAAGGWFFGSLFIVEREMPIKAFMTTGVGDDEDPLKVLKLRYAKGEITKEEYEQKKMDLT